MPPFSDRFWTSNDGLKLHYRDYAGREDRPPILCLPGLTRNARDFEQVAERLAGDWRVLCPDLRGRGDSAYAKDSASYVQAQYIEDIKVLLGDLQIERFVSFGTSLGALLTMLMATSMAERIAGALLNDAGPVLDVTGLRRIQGYVGQGRSFPTWMHAARSLEEVHRKAHPDFVIDDWLRMAKQTMAIAGNGRIVFDYDMKIGEPFRQLDVENLPDLWAGFEALARTPLLVVRGGLSDLLSAETAKEMHRRVPACEMLTLPRVGHTPSLSEPEAEAAMDRLLAKIA